MRNMKNKETSNTTFMDEVVKDLLQSCLHKGYGLLLRHYLFEEAFDSEAIEMDINYKANIDKLLKNESAIERIQEFIKTVNRQKSTFSIGWCFHYWPMYEKDDLFIVRKFNDFKAEIIAYEHITKEQYDSTMAKALELAKTKKVKATTTKYGNACFEIAANAIIGLWHLIAIILYTDFSAHCSKFSAAFRSLTPFETLSVTKKRNANFYWMARRLREEVEVFERNRTKHRLKGPFYCGVNRRMVIPQFNLRLNAPTSTTKQIEVALHFGGSEGIILQLNNDSNGWKDGLRAFCVSHLSRFASESERY